MTLTFTDLLKKAELDPRQVRMLRHKEPAATRGRSVYELWLNDRPAFDAYQAQHGPRAHQLLQRARYWASFVATPSSDTMFVGLYAAQYARLSTSDITVATTGLVVPAGRIHLYNVNQHELLSDISGRLFIEWGQAPRAWVQRPDKRPKRIVELRREFSDPAFPGYLHFVTPLSMVPGLPASWAAALRAARGIYVLSCARTRELYVGSAVGNEGFWQRWNEYARDGHGGNVQLKSRDRSDYQVSIVEVVGSSTADADVLGLEALWKRKLRTREMGLNSN